MLLPQGLLLALPLINQISHQPGAAEEGARLLQAPPETSTSGVGQWVGQREQLASDFTLLHPPEQQEAENQG